MVLGFDYSDNLLRAHSGSSGFSSDETQAYQSLIGQIGDMKEAKQQEYSEFDVEIKQNYRKYYS